MLDSAFVEYLPKYRSTHMIEEHFAVCLYNAAEFGLYRSNRSPSILDEYSADGRKYTLETAECAAGNGASILQKYVSQAAKQVDAAGMEAFTPAQRAAIVRNPNLQAMFRGSQIDKAARELIKSDPAVAGLNRMVNKGADFINKATGQWWDMTTLGQWTSHVQKYGPGGTLLITK